MDEIKIAIRMETDAIAFYKEAAGRTSHPVGKKMFLSIAEDEKRHLELLTKILKKMDFSIVPVNPMEKIKTVFSELKDKMGERIKATSDEVEALSIAMGMEKEGFEFYRKLASEQKDAKLKALFTQLASEEEKHYDIFSNTESFLTDTGNWFMWSEHSIVEG